MSTEHVIKKIRLSNGILYTIYDNTALRIDPETGKLITGERAIDKLILGDTDLVITNVILAPATESIDNVLLVDEEGKVKKRSTDDLLKDIGGISYVMEDDNETLALYIGKPTV